MASDAGKTITKYDAYGRPIPASPTDPKKVAYDQYGQGRQVPADTVYNRWAPDTTYVGSGYNFETPPPAGGGQSGGGGGQAPAATGLRVGGSVYPMATSQPLQQGSSDDPATFRDNPNNPNITSPFFPSTGGTPSLTQPGYEAQALQALQQQGQSEYLNQRARLSDASFDKRLGALSGMIGGAGQPWIQHGLGPEGQENAARAAAFARAKEQAGNTANAALASLKGLYEQSGTMGSTMEAAKAGQIIGGAGAGVNEFTREQLMADLARAADIADMQYQGGITQRGQNLGAQQALFALMNNAGVIY